jgi:CheY-like chemotaxis protein
MKDDTVCVMIVEDELMLQDVYKLVLETKGFKVVTANNGQEALDKIKKLNPDIILLDVLMPVMDGKQFLRTVDLSKYPKTKVIVYSNLSDSSTEEEMLGLGAEQFILKSSMTPNSLVDVIQLNSN